MPDLKFSCPHCQQHIAADSGYAGMQINCPACNGSLVVPDSPAAAAPAAPTRAVGGGCPSCGKPMPRGAVLCTQCGYNVVAGKRTVGGKPTKNAGQVPWYKTAYPYVGLVVVVLGILFFLDKSGVPSAGVAAGVIILLYVLGTKILVLISAFQEGTGTGFLTLCVPFYAIYYVFFVNENSTLRILYGVSLFIQFGGFLI